MSLFVRVGMLFFFDDYFKYDFFFHPVRIRSKSNLALKSKPISRNLCMM